MLALAVWLVFANLFHDGSPASGPVYAAGVALNFAVAYYLVRVWCQGLDDTADLIKIIALLILPIAMEMMVERFTGKNLFSIFGGVPENVLVREGKFRAQGPFGHPILAGTVGAALVPLFFGVIGRSKWIAIIGIFSGVCMVVTSASSGPVMTLAAGLAVLLAWRLRGFTRAFRWAALVIYLALAVVMERPPYYLISKIDISGGSTGWHRCFLIEQTLSYLPEWWLVGTDHTRHWMPNQGTAILQNHTDVTNYYVAYAIMGGLPGVILLITIFWKSFKCVGNVVEEVSRDDPGGAFLVWCFGASLFSHAVTGISVSYFDQSVIFVWLDVAIIGSYYSNLRQAEMVFETADGLPQELEA